MRGCLIAQGADNLEHVGYVRQRCIASGEGSHDLTGIWLDAKAVEHRDLEALGGRDQAEDADHRKAAIVDLGEQRLLLALGDILLVKPKGSHRLRGTGWGKAISSDRESLGK